jgi:hypothetical protein
MVDLLIHSRIIVFIYVKCSFSLVRFNFWRATGFHKYAKGNNNKTNNNQPKTCRCNGGGKGMELHLGGVREKCATLRLFEGIMVTKMALRV